MLNKKFRLELNNINNRLIRIEELLKKSTVKSTPSIKKGRSKYKLRDLLKDKKLVKEYYCASELAKILNVSDNTIHNMIKDKRLKAHKIGAMYYIKRADLPLPNKKFK